MPIESCGAAQQIGQTCMHACMAEPTRAHWTSQPATARHDACNAWPPGPIGARSVTVSSSPTPARALRSLQPPGPGSRPPPPPPPRQHGIDACVACAVTTDDAPARPAPPPRNTHSQPSLASPNARARACMHACARGGGARSAASSSSSSGTPRSLLLIVALPGSAHTRAYAS
jgi:hypothetical protein